MFKIRAVDIFEDFVECCGVKLDLGSRLVILHTLIVVFLKLIQKSLRSKSLPLMCYMLQ
jgi:hypothetical protein